MKVLLTGASGFLGRSVVELLSRQGIETVVAGRREPHGVLASNFLRVDLLGSIDFDELVRSSGTTHLLHLAWYAEHGKYWTSPLNLRWIDATIRLTEAFCLAGGQKNTLWQRTQRSGSSNHVIDFGPPIVHYIDGEQQIHLGELTVYLPAEPRR